MVAGQPGLISTFPHRSLDGLRCINFGHWQSLEDFAKMDENRPFSPIFDKMLDLANNEYQETLHQVFSRLDTLKNGKAKYIFLNSNLLSQIGELDTNKSSKFISFIGWRIFSSPSQMV